MQGGATQAIRGYRRGAPTQQMPPAPPEPFGRIGIAGNLCVARRQRCPRIASSSRLDLARYTYARDLLYFHHGLLEFQWRLRFAGPNGLHETHPRPCVSFGNHLGSHSLSRNRRNIRNSNHDKRWALSVKSGYRHCESNLRNERSITWPTWQE